jgi:histidinol dehydrogenase
MKLVKVGSKQFQKLCDRNSGRNKRVTESVRKIVENVKLYGDDAVIKYTRKFDRIKLTQKELRVSECETSGAYQDIKRNSYRR